MLKENLEDIALVRAIEEGERSEFVARDEVFNALSSTDLTIRYGKAEDAGLLAELGARTFSEAFAADNTAENMAAYLASAFNPEQQTAELADDQCVFLIAENHEVRAADAGSFDARSEAVGYAMLRSGNVVEGVTGNTPIELVRLYVAQESLGRGVGAALMQACINEAKQNGYDTLWLGVWEHNYRAQRFYRKWNFQAVGTHVFQLGDDPQTDILMQRCI